MTRTAAAAALAGVLLACVSSADHPGVPEQPEQPEQPEAGEFIEVSGDVVVTGSEPFTMLVLVTESERYELVGELAEELRRLQPFNVTVRGRLVRQAHAPVLPARLHVDSYSLARDPG